MPYWDNLGRAFLLEDTQDNADDITWTLNEAGIDATVSYQDDKEHCIVTVPKDQEEAAWNLLQQLWLKKETPADPDTYYREHYLKQSPDFIPSEEKFRRSTNSSILFLIAGFLVMLLALGHFFLVITQRSTDTISGCSIELLLGFFFTCFGFNSHQKVRMLETRMEEENSFTDQIVKWCTTIYSADYIDKCIDASSDDEDHSDSERMLLRRQLIQNFILREYDISDTAYLDFITDMIYKRLYFPNAVSAS